MERENYEAIDKKYLIKENRKLRMEIKELKQFNQMHKNALITLSDPHASANALTKTLLKIIKGGFEAKKVEELKAENAELDSKVVVMEKIMEQAISSEKQTYNLLADQFHELKQDNMKKDDQLNKFYQKIGQVDYLSGLVTKYIEVLAPSEQAMAFQKQQAHLLDMLNMQKDSIKKLTDEKQKLMKINVHLKEELDRRKQQVRNMSLMLIEPYLEQQANGQNGHNNMILDELQNGGTGQPGSADRSVELGHRSMMAFNHLNHSLLNMSVGHNPNNNSVLSALNFIKLQNQLIKQQAENELDSDSDAMADCPEMAILFPDKVQQIRSNRQKKKVPYLNMLKVRQLMVQRENKIKKQMEAANAHINPTTKIIKLQGQLDITRKQLANHMLKYRTLSEENKQILYNIDQLEARNQALLIANERLTKIYQNLFEEYQFCRAVTVRVQSVIGKKLRGESLANINQIVDQCFNQKFRQDEIENRENSSIHMNGNSSNAHENSRLEMNEYITKVLLKRARVTNRKRAISR